ncbi:MAG TPA: hypothetical protein VFU21_21555, partial [Kofleriaceae bacterium]|nr:hypothetical protein [Kofleriaceae bacterium]
MTLHAASLESPLCRNATGIRVAGQSAHRLLSRAHDERPDASSISWIIGRHAPQPVPAPQASPTSSTVRAPSAMAVATSRSLAALQRQTYTVLFENNFQIQTGQEQLNSDIKSTNCRLSTVCCGPHVPAERGVGDAE